jgi:DNA-binding SARP family transcriptional activator
METNRIAVYKEEMMTELQIRLLGQFSVSLENTPSASFASDKVRALFAYLVTEVHCPHRREVLANLLWSDQPEETCRANLRRALSNLRKCIQDHDANPPYLLITRQDIQFNPESKAWVDIAVLDQLYRQSVISPENQQQYHQILDLYQGEFLEGFSIADSMYFNEWLLMMREQQNRKMITILYRIASYHEERREFEEGLRFAWRLVEMEPWQEDARRQLMRLLVQAGKRHEALNQYKILADQLKKELDIEPETQTTSLYNSIREGKQLAAVEPASRNLPEITRDAVALHSTFQEVFVGCDAELGELNQMLDAVLSGQGSVGFISGEAGSGKSMLVREFIRRAQARHSALVSAVGFCNPFSGVGDPYLPFREILLQLCGNVEHTRSTGLLSRPYVLRLWNSKPEVIKALTLHGDGLLNTLISFQALLNIAAPLEDSHPAIFAGLTDLVKSKSIQPGGIPPQPNIFTQYAAVLKAVAREYPLLLVLDDLQWADAGTIGLLFHLGRHLAGSPILLLGAFRSEEISIRQDGAPHPLMPVLSELQRDHGEITISLDRSGDKAFVDDLLASEPNALDESFHDSLLRHTNGHPLFTVELLRDLQENGTLVRDRKGRWVVKQDFQIDKLPPKIEGIIGERINRLPTILRQMLAAASVEGEAFTAEVIAEVEGLPMPQVINLFSRQLDKQHRLVRAQQPLREPPCTHGANAY